MIKRLKRWIYWLKIDFLIKKSYYIQNKIFIQEERIEALDFIMDNGLRPVERFPYLLAEKDRVYLVKEDLEVKRKDLNSKIFDIQTKVKELEP